MDHSDEYLMDEYFIEVGRMCCLGKWDEALEAAAVGIARLREIIGERQA